VTRISECDRVYRCWNCKRERVLTAAEDAIRKSLREPLTSPFAKCECGEFYALYRFAHPADSGAA